ncbi:hypothetical protein, partial [Streptomyces sp. SA3_actF]|uniref:hypothetical protein n=1 Tax=Streptomyces sp. SA3_actF TaxID=682181 RepID=UPI001F1A898D
MENSIAASLDCHILIRVVICIGNTGSDAACQWQCGQDPGGRTVGHHDWHSATPRTSTARS